MTNYPRQMGVIRSLARTFARNSPLQRGAYRVADLALRIGGEIPEEICVVTDDGREIVVNPRDHAYRYSYFLGQYEPAITRHFPDLINPGDVCLDLGANLGWYTTLMLDLTGENGRVHAFEPTPRTMERLKLNVGLSGFSENAVLNECALGAEGGVAKMELDEGLPDGHAAIVNDGVVAGYEVEIKTLDSYLQQNNVGQVDFLKVDIEGSELSMFKGATSLFEQETVPTMVVEMALDTSEKFGYLPQDLIEFLDAHARYRYFEICEPKGELRQITAFEKDSRGANVLCVPIES